MTERRDLLKKSIAAGAVIKIEGCPCPGDHAGEWRIDEYIPEADDYRIIRISDNKVDYVHRHCMRIVCAK